MGDREDLAQALREIRRLVPHATAVKLETSDQNEGYGFILKDVLTDGQPLSSTSPALLRDLESAVHEHLCDIDWDGAVGENKNGFATIQLVERDPAPTPTIDQVMAYEQGDMDEGDVPWFFQGLIDSGMAWQLQGSYGRAARDLINSGICHEA